jgi:hypothetical protein
MSLLLGLSVQGEAALSAKGCHFTFNEFTFDL